MTTTRICSAAMASALVLTLSEATDVLAQGCAMCGGALAADDTLGRAFNWSILFLMAAPYTIAGTVMGWLFYTHRRAPGRRRAAVIEIDRPRHPTPADRPGGDAQ